uniref:hypothetical protein n=1 Tax=Escherichia coli TaxID=562 RepID=UPI000A7083A7
MKNETNTMATKNDNGATPRFSQRQLQALCSDIDSQPKWRDAANKVNRPGFPGECFICELRLPDHRFRWKHNKLF